MAYQRTSPANHTYVTNLDTLASVSQERTHPPDDHVRDIELRQLCHQDVVVDVVKRFSVIYKDCAIVPRRRL